MKVSEAIDQLQVGDTVWVKGEVNYTNKAELFSICCDLATTSFWICDDDEISLTEPQADKVVVTEKQAELLRAFKGESLYELLANCLGEDEELMAKAKLFGYTVEQPKRWVVKFEQDNEQFYFNSWMHVYSTQPIGYARKEADNVIKFTDKKKAEAVATLVEGSVEEV